MACYAAGVLLAAFAALVALPLQAQAQVSNAAATGKPEISGTAQVGMTLQAAPGDIDDADGLTGASYSYRWRRAGADGMDIPGATSSNYTLTPADYGKEIKVWADFTDDGGSAETRISSATLPVAPAACPTDAATIWCDTLTVGYFLDADGDPTGVGYEARTGNDAYGSLATTATFQHLGVGYTVTLVNAGGTQDLYFATTPNLPADGAGLTVHVQTYGGELDAPLAEGAFQSGTQDWYFQGKVNTFPTTPLSDVPLIRLYNRNARIVLEPDLGTEVAVRLSYASTLPPGQTAVFFGASSYTASEGGASPGDYSGVPPSVTFQAGQTRRTFPVTATDDSVDDDGESVRIGFGTFPEGFVAGARATATVALADDDGPVTEVFFDGAADLTVKEGNVTRVSVYLSEPARATVTIPLTKTHRGGATAADYSGVPESVTFRRLGRRKQFTLWTTDDDDNDDNESLRIGFGPLPAGIRASTASHRPPTRTVHIEDDDGVDHWNVWFGQEAYTAAEGGAAARVSIHLDAPVEIAPLDVRLVLRYGGGPPRDPGGGDVRAGRADEGDHGDGDRRHGRRRRRERVDRVRESALRPGVARRRADHGDGGAAGQRRGRAGDGVVRGGDLQGDGRRFRRDGARGTGRGARPLGDGAADEGPRRRRDGGGLLRHSGDRDIRGRPDGGHVHRDGDQRLGRGRRRERVDRVRAAAGRQRAADGRGELRHEYQRRTQGARGREISAHAGPEQDPAATGDDPAEGDAPGRRDGGGLRGDPGERDVRAERAAGGLHHARGAGPAGRDRRGPADRHRPDAAGGCARATGGRTKRSSSWTRARRRRRARRWRGRC